METVRKAKRAMAEGGPPLLVDRAIALVRTEVTRVASPHASRVRRSRRIVAADIAPRLTRHICDTSRAAFTDIVGRLRPRARDRLIVTRSRLLHVPVVHAIGDSQTGVLHGTWPFVVHHIGPVTAYNLASPHSSTNSRAALCAALRRVDRSRDIVLLVAGGVDCRIHIHNQHMRSHCSLSLEELVRRTIERYGEAIELVRTRGYRVSVQSVAGGVYQDNIYGYEHYADIVERGRIAQLFNRELRSWCSLNGVGYVDLFSQVADERGVVLTSMVSDGVHLNRTALPCYSEWLRANVFSRWAPPAQVRSG